MTRPTWDDTFMEHCRLIAKRSKDPSTQVGCVVIKSNVILSSGYNGPPRGVNDEKALKLERPIKYHWFEHAERNAIYNAARIGACLEGGIIYTTQVPCAACTRAIIQAGIHTIILPEERNKDYEKRWASELYHACCMLNETKIWVRYVNSLFGIRDHLTKYFYNLGEQNDPND